ncbi:hypothetical protein J1605_018406 [Eschrichtius robustus]|uniref:Uncharacterized protein n=1 Tax=Eschrichtius robustus TaxID=9764 RepID=A0AB34HUM6_ESCRO|nr:hypothetical protein J1605_018406 [Eschrichtius robustus]
MWGLPGPGIEPMSPALAGGFLTTAPPGKSIGESCYTSMWDLPRPGLEPVSPALAGRFSTTAPPGKPRYEHLSQALGMRASVVIAHGLSSCGARAQPLRGMWDPPGPGLEPVSPALAGGFLTTTPPGKPRFSLLTPGHFPVPCCPKFLSGSL